MGLIEHIRSKTPEARAKYAFGLAVGITCAVALVWLSTLPSQFADVSLTPSSLAKPAGLDTLLDDAKTQAAQTFGSVPPETVALPSTANLDMLAAPEAGTETEASAHEDAVPPPEEEASLPAPKTERSSEHAVYEKPGPKVILIGTTTARTTE